MCKTCLHNHQRAEKKKKTVEFNHEMHQIGSEMGFHMLAYVLEMTIKLEKKQIFIFVWTKFILKGGIKLMKGIVKA